MFWLGSGRPRAGIRSKYRLSLKMAQKGSKKRKKAQKDSKRRSKRLFEPVRCHQCARRGCSSLLRCRLCVQRSCSRLLFKITIRKCWARLHCALSHCTLLCFAPCMYMHGAKQSKVQWLRAQCSRAQHFRIVISNSSLEQPLRTHRRHRSRLEQALRAHWRQRAGSNSLFERLFEPLCAFLRCFEPF